MFADIIIKVKLMIQCHIHTTRVPGSILSDEKMLCGFPTFIFQFLHFPRSLIQKRLGRRKERLMSQDHNVPAIPPLSGDH
jgi:hypothetical protein